jgi:exopolysaccharide production protein ExoY
LSRPAGRSSNWQALRVEVASERLGGEPARRARSVAAAWPAQDPNDVAWIRTPSPADEASALRRTVPSRHALEVAAKRAIDLVISVVGLLLLLPLLLVIAIVVRLDSRGPVFFVQPRMGLDGEDFQIVKFRTMHLDGDERLELLLACSPEARTEFDTFRKLADDPRLTRVGRLLRRYSLDELPQLFSVMTGDMSIVGPRPYLREETAGMDGREAVILAMRPGLTGLWQISGRNQLTFAQRVAMDVAYVSDWRLSADIRILFRTPWIVLTGLGHR